MLYIYIIYTCYIYTHDFYIIDTYDIFHVIYRVDKSLSLYIYIHTLSTTHKHIFNCTCIAYKTVYPWHPWWLPHAFSINPALYISSFSLLSMLWPNLATKHCHRSRLSRRLSCLFLPRRKMCRQLFLHSPSAPLPLCLSAFAMLHSMLRQWWPEKLGPCWDHVGPCNFLVLCHDSSCTLFSDRPCCRLGSADIGR